MIIAGPCSYIDDKDTNDIISCAVQLRDIADVFRVKIYLGGTKPSRYIDGIGDAGIDMLEEINNTIMPVITEVHVPEQIDICSNLYGLWLGARNSQNYTVLRSLKDFTGEKMLKRGPGMVIEELIGLYGICKMIHGYEPWLIERGVNYLGRSEVSRWSICINDILLLKHTRPDIFDKLIVDCSHSAGNRDYVGDIYKSMKAIGVKNYMFECTVDGCSRTDIAQMISVNELKEILKG